MLGLLERNAMLAGAESYDRWSGMPCLLERDAMITGAESYDRLSGAQHAVIGTLWESGYFLYVGIGFG